MALTGVHRDAWRETADRAAWWRRDRFRQLGNAPQLLLPLGPEEVLPIIREVQAAGHTSADRVGGSKCLNQPLTDDYRRSYQPDAAVLGND